MELEYFVLPETSDEYHAEFVETCFNWFVKYGIKPDHLRKYVYPQSELSHYSRATTDIEFAFPIEKGWAELMGIANRTDYDLRMHGKFTKGDDQAFATPIDDEGKKKVVPYVIEPSMGVDRTVLAFLLDAYDVIEGGRSTTTESVKEQEVVLRLHKTLAPYQIAILPLSKKPELVSVAEDITKTLREHWSTDYDETSSIGKRYRRQDEIGTPYCITVDFDTLEGVKRPKGTVTVRDRDTMAQENIAIPELVDYIRAKLA
jgi:glycyl-tRNA synthetase